MIAIDCFPVYLSFKFTDTLQLEWDVLEANMYLDTIVGEGKTEADVIAALRQKLGSLLGDQSVVDRLPASTIVRVLWGIRQGREAFQKNYCCVGGSPGA
jgi:hypothetical protein